MLKDHTVEFEMVGSFVNGDQIRQTHLTFRNITHYENYIISIGQGYDSDDSIFNGCIFNLNRLDFSRVSRSQYGNGCDFTQEIIEYHGHNCFIPTKTILFFQMC